MPPTPEELTCPTCSGPKTKQARRCAKCAAGSGAHTSEQRDHLSTPLCGAKKRNGELCRAFAGQGTSTPGVGRCKYHGGATTAHRKHAVAVEAKRRMVTMGGPIDTTAPDALLGLLRASAGHVAWLAQEVAALDALTGHDAQVLVSLYDTERDRLQRVGEACVRAGVAQSVVRLQEAQAAGMLHVLRDAARDIGLNRDQLQAFGVALRKRLAESNDPEGADTAAADERLAELRARIKSSEGERIARAAEKRAREITKTTDLFPPDSWTPDAA